MADQPKKEKGIQIPGTKIKVPPKVLLLVAGAFVVILLLSRGQGGSEQKTGEIDDTTRPDDLGQGSPGEGVAGDGLGQLLQVQQENQKALLEAMVGGFQGLGTLLQQQPGPLPSAGGGGELIPVTPEPIFAPAFDGGMLAPISPMSDVPAPFAQPVSPTPTVKRTTTGKPLYDQPPSTTPQRNYPGTQFTLKNEKEDRPAPVPASRTRPAPRGGTVGGTTPRPAPMPAPAKPLAPVSGSAPIRRGGAAPTPPRPAPRGGTVGGTIPPIRPVTPAPRPRPTPPRNVR